MYIIVEDMRDEEGILWFKIYGDTKPIKEYLKERGYWWFPDELCWAKPIVKVRGEDITSMRKFRDVQGRLSGGRHTILEVDAKLHIYKNIKTLMRVYRKTSSELQFLNRLVYKHGGRIEYRFKVLDYEAVEKIVNWYSSLE